MSAGQVLEILHSLFSISKQKVFIADVGTLTHKLVANISPSADLNIVVKSKKEISYSIEQIKVLGRDARETSQCLQYCSQHVRKLVHFRYARLIVTKILKKQNELVNSQVRK